MSILKEGYPFILPPLLAGAALVLVSRTCLTNSAAMYIALGLGAVLLIFALFCVFFFRDPKIEITQGEKIILSPCNGTVMEIVEEENEKIIRTFLSIFNVHLQRSPVDGTVSNVTHQDGKFLMAWDPQAHVLNEQNIITIQGEDSVYVVRQIAGFLARRCVSWVKSGDVLKAGDKIGMIKFSSQVDLHLPNTAVIKVQPGDKVRAGITVMGTK
ncbi:phosphatidylserine decarboxylase proenzyme [Spirochaetia bacterium]|nr:phosphatidylserine decarboxylase proenzyme [Spirochaetia bacterium]